MGKWDGAAAVQEQERLRAGFLRTEEATGIISGQKEENHEHIMKADGEVRSREEPMTEGKTWNPQAEMCQGWQALQAVWHRGWRNQDKQASSPTDSLSPSHVCTAFCWKRHSPLWPLHPALQEQKRYSERSAFNFSLFTLRLSLTFQGLELCTIILLPGSSFCSWSKSSGAFLPAPVHQTEVAPEASSLWLGALSKLLPKQGSKENGQYLRAGAVWWERLGMGI